MRRRLLLVLAIIGAVSIAGFAVPLIEVSSQARTRQFVQQRDSDVTRFAALSNEYVTNGNSARIADEISAYHEVYGDSVLIVSTRGVPDLSVGPIDEEMRAAVARGLRNERSSELRHVAPWGPDSAVFVAPVGSGAQVNGTAVLRSSTAATRADIGRWWLLIVGGAVVVVLAFAALAVALSRWVLRPLADLSDAMTGLAAELPVIPATVTEETNPTTAATRAGGPPEVRQLTDTFDGLVGAVLRSVEMQRQLVAAPHINFVIRWRRYSSGSISSNPRYPTNSPRTSPPSAPRHSGCNRSSTSCSRSPVRKPRCSTVRDVTNGARQQRYSPIVSSSGRCPCASGVRD